MESLIYEDTPHFQRGAIVQIWKPQIIGIATIITLVIMLILLPVLIIGEKPWLYLPFFVILAFLIDRIRWPRRYQIYSSKIRIVCGSPIHYDFSFNNIENAYRGDWTDIIALRLNFTQSYTKNIVTIVRKKGMSINITPENPGTFIEHLDKALIDWRQSNPST